MSSSSDTTYRVNRLGQEIFSGDRTAFEQAVRSKRIRSDDLIYDEDSAMWVFTRNHPIFVELVSHGIEDLEKNHLHNKKRFHWRQFILSNLFLVGLLYLLIYYSAEIEFKQSEATSDLSDQSTKTSNAALRDEKSSTQDTSDQSKGEDGQGGAGESGEGGNAEQSQENSDQQDQMGTEEEEKVDPLLAETGEEIEMVFDLSDVDALQTLKMLEGTQSLSDSSLLKRANEIRNESLSGKASYHRLQEGLALAEFVLDRSIYKKQECLRQKCVQMAVSKKQRKKLEKLNFGKLKRLQRECEQCRKVTPSRTAQAMISGLSQKLKQQCQRLYSQRACAYKVKHPQWSHSTIQGILDKKVLLGMTLEQAFEAWGPAKEKLPEFGGNFRYCYDRKCNVSFSAKRGKVITVDIVDEDDQKQKKKKRSKKKAKKKKN